MGFPQNDYAGRLPYGYWFSPSENREYLFDRGYKAIASRPLEAPWEVTIYPKRRFIDKEPGRVQAYFFADGRTARASAENRSCFERIIAYFCLGRDVRAWLKPNLEARKNLPQHMWPKTRGSYLPEWIPPKKMELLDPGEGIDQMFGS